MKEQKKEENKARGRGEKSKEKKRVNGEQASGEKKNEKRKKEKNFSLQQNQSSIDRLSLPSFAIAAATRDPGEHGAEAAETVWCLSCAS